MKILDRFPIATVERAIGLPGGKYFTVKPYQIAVMVCLKVRGHLTPAFPAFIDSGHNHNFSITEEQLRDWARVDPSSIEKVGKLRINNQEVVLRKADLLIYRNHKNSDQFTDEAHELPIGSDRGIAVHDRPISTLPLIGLRALLRNKVSLAYDAKGLTVTLST